VGKEKEDEGELQWRKKALDECGSLGSGIYPFLGYQFDSILGSNPGLPDPLLQLPEDRRKQA